jgi:hypothetical protein
MTASVAVYGADGTFGALAGWTSLSTGETFYVTPVSGWTTGPGEMSWFTAAGLNDGICWPAQPLGAIALQPSADHAALSVLDSGSGKFTRIVVPTSTGALAADIVGLSVGGADIGDVQVVNGNICWVSAYPYHLWNIAQYGQYPLLGRLHLVNGVWQIDAAHCFTISQCAAASANPHWPVRTNSFGETFRGSFSTSETALLPASQKLVFANYLGLDGTRSGCLQVIDPDTGAELAFLQLPNVVKNDGIFVQLDPREVECDPTSSLNDERFVIIYDAFETTGGAAPHSKPWFETACVQEFSYNASTQTITVVSPPVYSGLSGDGQGNVTTSPNQQMPYGTCQFDSAGNLWIEPVWANSFGLAFGGPMCVYMKSGSGRPSLGSAAGDWNTTQWATAATPDYVFPLVANQAASRGLKFDSEGRFFSVSNGGVLTIGTPTLSNSGNPSLLLETDSTYETGLVASATFCSVVQSTAQAYDGTHSAKMTSASTGGFSYQTPAANQFPVTPSTVYEVSARFRAGSGTALCRIGLQLVAADGTTLGTLYTGGDVVANDTGWTKATMFVTTGTALFARMYRACPSPTTNGEVVYVDDCEVRPRFDLITQTTLGIGQLQGAAGHVTVHKPCLDSHDRIWIPVGINTAVTYPTPAPARNAWLYSYDMQGRPPSVFADGGVVMGRSQLRHTVTDTSGNAIQGAVCHVFLAGTTTPVTDLWTSQTGGTAVTTLTSDGQGEIVGWVDVPKLVDVLITDGNHSAFLANTPSVPLSWPSFTETLMVDPDASYVPAPVVSSTGIQNPPVFDASVGKVFQYTLGANVASSSISNPVAGQRITIEWVQDGTGSRTYVWPTNCKFAGAAAPTATTTANRRDSVSFRFDGTNWLETSRAVGVG